jgi:hypothetical protein
MLVLVALAAMLQQVAQQIVVGVAEVLTLLTIQVLAVLA